MRKKTKISSSLIAFFIIFLSTICGVSYWFYQKSINTSTNVTFTMDDIDSVKESTIKIVSDSFNLKIFEIERKNQSNYISNDSVQKKVMNIMNRNQRENDSLRIKLDYWKQRYVDLKSSVN